MKRLKSILCLGAFMFGFAMVSWAQKVLPEIEIVAVNYKYLSSVDARDAAMPVKTLEREAAAFDLKNSEFYEDEYDNYFVSFFIPEGKILAAYDKDGNLLRTAEKFKDVALPVSVSTAVAKRFPQWSISKDVYLVSYHERNGVIKRYKLLLENGKKRLRVKVDENGSFL